MPSVSVICWHAIALITPSKTVAKRGGFMPRKRLAKRPQPPIVRGELVEFRQVDVQAQQPLQGRCHGSLNRGTDRLARHRDL